MSDSSREFRELADRFRRIAATSHADTDAAEQRVREAAAAAGHLYFARLESEPAQPTVSLLEKAIAWFGIGPKLEFACGNAALERALDVQAVDWYANSELREFGWWYVWLQTADFLCQRFDILPGDPHCLRWCRRGEFALSAPGHHPGAALLDYDRTDDPETLVGIVHPDDWQGRAENYATICDWLTTREFANPSWHNESAAPRGRTAADRLFRVLADRFRRIATAAANATNDAEKQLLSERMALAGEAAAKAFKAAFEQRCLQSPLSNDDLFEWGVRPWPAPYAGTPTWHRAWERLCKALYSSNPLALPEPQVLVRASRGKAYDCLTTAENYATICDWLAGRIVPRHAERLDTAAGEPAEPTADAPTPASQAETDGQIQLVTLEQCAAIVSRSKRTLEKYKGKGLPEPVVQGGHGKPSEYDWRQMRPWLEAKFGRKLPERFPAHRPLDPR